MMKSVSGMATRVSAESVGRFYVMAVDILDCAIPLVLVAVIIISCVAIATGAIS
jgi:hypothetical protein